MIVVSDTSPITNLAAIGQLDLLRQLYQNVIIPAAVYHELTAAGGSHPGAIVRSFDWFKVQDVTNRLLVTALRIELDEGEAEAIALARKYQRICCCWTSGVGEPLQSVSGCESLACLVC